MAVEVEAAPVSGMRSEGATQTPAFQARLALMYQARRGQSWLRYRQGRSRVHPTRRSRSWSGAAPVGPAGRRAGGRAGELRQQELSTESEQLDLAGGTASWPRATPLPSKTS